ncbi:O-Antigen ligase [Stieleria maiorica]|uniref:O-Antigen ligase n=1 Tax=Stieleria maiorica TaxID=2795974 RepID=A0A5B9MIL3_9BACT|nr:O-antigen ligase family protein [Stieleria maiorica]QEF99494.1 O-Antigen ligase [Stieleria maiorica]
MFYWIAAIALAITPGIVASDFGGILPWTKYTSALAIASACSIALIARLVSIGCPGEIRLPGRAFAATGLLLACSIYAGLQTVPLPAGVIAWLSPASYSAYVTWAGEIIDIDPSQSIPISLAPFDSRHAIACLSIAVLISFFSVLVFQHRGRMAFLLSAIAIGACSVAVIGLGRKLFPDFHLWSFRSGGEGAPFGTFLNRNNAALAINVGVAAALGLLVYRTTALMHQRGAASMPESGGGRASLNGLWLRDPLLLGSLVSLCVCLIGVLGCGSRGGLLAMLVAAAATTFFARQQMVRLGVPVTVIAVVALIAVVLLRTGSIGPQTLREDTIGQIGATVSADGNRLSGDTRLAHWPDGFRAAWEHFPGGSGLASYGYAYLPWQETSPWRHCLHADNLWLEMLAELGLAGLVLAALATLLIVSGLKRLHRSSDPIDQGLWVCGCFLSIVIAVSQTFDFGLVLPANLIAVATILPVVLARSSLVIVAAKQSDEAGKGAKPKLQLVTSGPWWRSPTPVRQRVVQTGCAVGLLIVAAVAIARLRRDSAVDYTLRTAEIELRAHRTDQPWLDSMAAECRTLAERHPHPDLLDLRTRLEFERGRLLELDAMNVTRLPEDHQTAAYALTSRGRRRLSWRASEPTLSNNVTDAGRSVPALPLLPSFRRPESPYASALRSSEESLRQRPLAMPPRIDQVFLEFVHQTPPRTKTAIEQSAELFRNTPELQLRFGALAANHGDYVTATKAWKRAATLDPGMVTRVLGRARRFPDFPVRDVIPDIADRKARADQYLN